MVQGWCSGPAETCRAALAGVGLDEAQLIARTADTATSNAYELGRTVGLVALPVIVGLFLLLKWRRGR